MIFIRFTREFSLIITVTLIVEHRPLRKLYYKQTHVTGNECSGNGRTEEDKMCKKNQKKKSAFSAGTKHLSRRVKVPGTGA